MEKIYVKEILKAVGGQLLGNIDPDKTFVVNVQTDSREAAAGDLFVAIIGERLDAHRFVPGAMAAGAEGCLVSAAPESIPDGKFCVLVPDTTKAMGDLAAYYRSKLGLPVVAVTGSVGKTTTKDMIFSVLSTKYRTLKTEGNKNNHLGLPMTIFRLSQEDEIAVLEMGMNHLGEIDYLVRIAQPDVAVITNVGEAHIGNLGSRENILRAKCEIFRGLKAARCAESGSLEYRRLRVRHFRSRPCRHSSRRPYRRGSLRTRSFRGDVRADRGRWIYIPLGRRIGCLRLQGGEHRGHSSGHRALRSGDS